MKIVYIPLDERPCNTDYVKNTVTSVKNVTISALPKEFMGYKKQAGKKEEIWKFLYKELENADYAVISTEMLMYGGLLASRLHNFKQEEVDIYGNRIRHLRKKYPNVKFFFSNLIMRTPRYNSSDEEPDYYEVYGEKIFKLGWLKNKSERGELSHGEQIDLENILKEIPQNVVEDYENRRLFNSQVNLLSIDLVKEEVIDFLVIPQDDSAEYGYTTQDQKLVYSKIKKSDLRDSVMVYPGADEVGFTLIARAYNDYQKYLPKIFVHYAATLGPSIIPLYEDRIIQESLKAHIMATGMKLVESREAADFILAYNTPGKIMQESWEQFENNDVTYDTFRHLLTFAQEIETDIESGKPTGICDSAYSNGGDLELIAILDNKNLLEQVAAYKAWNTNCNSLGSVLNALSFSKAVSTEQHLNNLASNLYEDAFYQAVIRRKTTEHFLPKLGKNYFDISGIESEVETYVKDELATLGRQYLKQTFANKAITFANFTFPWQRMFECNCQVHVSEQH